MSGGTIVLYSTILYFFVIWEDQNRNPNMNNKDLEGLEEGLMSGGDKVEEYGLKPNQLQDNTLVTHWFVTNNKQKTTCDIQWRSCRKV